MPATSPMTLESLQADVVRLDSEIARINGLLTEKTGENDALRGQLEELTDKLDGPGGVRAQLTAAQKATAQARLERNVGCAIAAILALFIGGLIGFWVAPKGDTTKLNTEIVRLGEKVKDAEKAVADCRNTPAPVPTTPTAPAPAPTPVPATGTAGGNPAIADATTVVVINPGGNGQQPSVTVEKKRGGGGTQVTPQAPVPAPQPQGPQSPTTVPDGGCFLKSNGKAELKTNIGSVVPSGVDLARQTNQQLLDDTTRLVKDLKAKHPAWLSDDDEHKKFCLGWRQGIAKDLLTPRSVNNLN